MDMRRFRVRLEIVLGLDERGGQPIRDTPPLLPCPANFVAIFRVHVQRDLLQVLDESRLKDSKPVHVSINRRDDGSDGRAALGLPCDVPVEVIQRRVSEGEPFARAAAAVGCSTKSIQRFMARTGGMMPRSRARSPLRLSLADREELSRGLQAGDSLRQIAARLGRAVSTISREVAWNGQRDAYRAWRAEQTAARRARRPTPEKVATHPRLCREVERRLLERWSPQQIAARLVCDYPDDREMRVSHETLYRSLFVQARGALRKELATCLRTGRTQRRSHQRTEHSGTGRLRHMVLISDRPAAAADRAVPGHWEGDLIVGKGGRSAIGTLVERSSRYVVLLHVPRGRTADLSVYTRAELNAVARQLNNRPRQTLGWMKPSEVFSRFVASTS